MDGLGEDWRDEIGLGIHSHSLDTVVVVVVSWYPWITGEDYILY